MIPDEGSAIGVITMQKVDDLTKRVESLEKHHKKWMLSPNLFKRSFSQFLNIVFIAILLALIVRGSLYLLQYLDTVQL
ncbi:hypothetical protein A2635_04070 [Candidatus Peribacteria bacterium RIFCSPHIGHO2_01_FULL_51_9]|nr:MAG: hypothetical protein A2635_04070 [Candidatus Peribacteria bacterium RIFCSPHIGHO2_01_FULL_51_9]